MHERPQFKSDHGQKNYFIKLCVKNTENKLIQTNKLIQKIKIINNYGNPFRLQS